MQKSWINHPQLWGPVSASMKRTDRHMATLKNLVEVRHGKHFYAEQMRENNHSACISLDYDVFLCLFVPKQEIR